MSDETTEEELPVLAEFMFAELRDCVLTEIKEAGESWQQMSQQRQDEVIFRVDRQVRNIVGRAARTYAAHGFPVVAGELESVTIKGGAAKATVKITQVSSGVLDLADSTDEQVLIVIADERVFSAQDGRVKSEADQPELPLEPADLVYERAGEWFWRRADPDEDGAWIESEGFTSMENATINRQEVLGRLEEGTANGTVGDEGTAGDEGGDETE